MVPTLLLCLLNLLHSKIKTQNTKHKTAFFLHWLFILSLSLSLSKSKSMATSFLQFQTLKTPFLKTHHHHKPTTSTFFFTPSAKFNLFELLGGRGLCNGESGLQKELNKPTQQNPPPPPPPQSQPSPPSPLTSNDDGSFEKELLGLTGGFPGGEKGLQRFIEENPPPQKNKDVSEGGKEVGVSGFQGLKPKAPELPLLMPGMIVIVKNANNPYHMYCGIVQRVTDGKAGVLFEGGNWDRLITFKLDELERRDKGPPMVNPKSAVLESIVEKSG